jgi:dephospho-CoA kinase
MAKILITGMSGTGKSTALLELQRRGHRVVDTDYGDWKELNVESGWVWREDLMRDLLTNHSTGTLYVAGTESNQGKFYSEFDAVVLLTAPLDILLRRIETRENNDFGKNPEERARVLADIEEIEPLLHRTSTHVIDTNCPLLDVADQLELIAQKFDAHLK